MISLKGYRHGREFLLLLSTELHGIYIFVAHILNWFAGCWQLVVQPGGLTLGFALHLVIVVFVNAVADWNMVHRWVGAGWVTRHSAGGGTRTWTRHTCWWYVAGMSQWELPWQLGMLWASWNPLPSDSDFVFQICRIQVQICHSITACSITWKTNPTQH